MTGAAGSVVRVQCGERLVTARPGAPVELPATGAVTALHVRVRCRACAQVAELAAAPHTVAVDDDHFAYRDEFVEARGAAACAGCGAALAVRLGYVVTVGNVAASRSLELDRSCATIGCELA